MSSWTERAKAVLPGGGFGNFDASLVIERGKGSRVWDADGNEYLDYLIGSGPMLLGHSHPEVVEAVAEQLSQGFSFFASNPKGIELAEVICDAVPCAEQLRYVSTGGEADMFAIRLARAFTGRSLIVKFEGAYHGMSDEGQMSLSPSKLIDFPQPEPDSAGILQAVQDQTLVIPWNSPEHLKAVFDQHGADIAAIIAEPLQRIIPAQTGFLQLLRAICNQHESLLIFDEVVTGFRFAWGGAQSLYGVVPDLCTLGKTIGGGMPLAAIAGRKDVMSLFDKSVAGDQWLMQVGTLSGNPIAAVAGLKTLEILQRPGQFERLRGLGDRIQAMLHTALSAQGIPHQLVGNPMLFDVMFSDQPISDYRDLGRTDKTLQSAFNASLRKSGILKSPAKLYPHLALTEDDLALTQAAIERAAKVLGQ